MHGSLHLRPDGICISFLREAYFLTCKTSSRQKIKSYKSEEGSHSHQDIIDSYVCASMNLLS